MQERRAHPRVRASDAVVATVVRARHLQPGTRVPGRLVDLSAAGLRFAPSAPFAVGDLVRLSLGPADDGEGAEAVVLRHEVGVDGAASTACRFTALQQAIVDGLRPAA